MGTFSFNFYMHFKNRFKVYLKYTSLLNSWLTKTYIVKTYFYKSFPNFVFKLFSKSHKLWKSKHIQKDTLDISILIWNSLLHISSIYTYNIQKYIWSIVQFQQKKTLCGRNLQIDGAMTLWLGHTFTKALVPSWKS